jgi:thymidylate kinase
MRRDAFFLLAAHSPRNKTLSANSLIDGARQDLSSTQVKAIAAHALIAALSDGSKAYCILSGYEQLPDAFDTDIDFMVDQDDFQRLPRLIMEVAHQTNMRLFQSVEHEMTARAYLLVSLSGQELTIVQPDSASDYRHFGSLWLRASEVLAERRWHARGFWIPSASHEFAYYLIKRLNKRDFGRQHGCKLHRLYAEDSHSCDRMLARFWSGQQRSALSRMAASNDWAQMDQSLESFRRELQRNTAESFPQKVAASRKHMFHFLNRVTRPTGGWIAFIGPDGCGKSLVIDAIRKQFSQTFRDVQCFHLRPGFLHHMSNAEGSVTDPHGQPPRGRIASVAKVFYFVADYFFGYLFQLVPAMIRSHLIIFDRYIDDLLVDSKRVRYSGPKWLLQLAARIVPRPDLVVLLDAPAEVLWSRKQEVPFNEVVRQRAAYLRMAHNLPSTIVVDAAQPVPGVVHDVMEVIVAHFSRRAAARLGLQVPPLSADGIEPDTSSRRC